MLERAKNAQSGFLLKVPDGAPQKSARAAGPLGSVHFGDICKNNRDGRPSRYSVNPRQRAVVRNQTQITRCVERTVAGYLPESVNT
jgi:hypothetical protein